MDCVNAVVLVAGNLLSVSGKAASSVMDDAVDSLLFSQLYADKENSRFSAPAQWFSHHNMALQQCKWAGLGYLNLGFEPDNDSYVTIEGLVEQALSSQLPKVQANEIKNMMVHVVALPEAETAHVLFRRRIVDREPADLNMEKASETMPVSTITLQISALLEGASLYSLFVSFKTFDVVELNLFSQSFDSNSIIGNVEMCLLEREWDAAAYAKVRAKVCGFLAKQEEGLIHVVPYKAPGNLGQVSVVKQ